MRAPYDVVFHAPWVGPLLAPGADLPAGGAETQVFLVATGLAARGARVGLLVEASAELPAQIAGVDVLQQSRSPRERRTARGVENVLRLVHDLARLDTRVVVQRAAGSRTGLIASIVKLRRSRFVYSSANIIDFDYGRLERSRRARALFHLGIRLAGDIVVQTIEQHELCRVRFGREAKVIRSIAEPADATRVAPEAFLWIGRLASYKRPLAYVELARAVPEARFRMVGVPAGDTGRDLAQQVARAASDVDNLELLDPRPREELMPLLARSVAVVNTSDYEGMPNVFLEGWARGIPALALTHDPDSVIAREGLGGYAAGRADSLAALARAMWQLRSDRADVTERCRGYVKREHSPGVVIGRWATVLGVP